MGNESSLSEGQSFDKRNWELTDTHQAYSVWRNRSDPTRSIIEHTIYSSSDAEEGEQKEMFILRKNHPTLVAARYLQSESSGQFCTSSHAQKLFIEKIPIRLSDIEHVSLPDSLHLYSQCLRGFQQLSRHVGCFSIEEEYVGINQNGVVKVWMNQNYFKNYFSGGKIAEEYMVKNLIELIQKKLDHDHFPRVFPSVRNFLYRNTDRLTFQDAIRQFNELVSSYFNGQVPTRLQCIDRVGGFDAIVHQQKQKTSEKNRPSKITQSPYLQNYGQADHTVQGNQRPQLVDSQFLKQQFPISTPPIQTSATYYEVPPGRLNLINGSQIVPNMQKNILTPSRVRQNTPIVRKSASIYNSPKKLPVNNLIVFEKQNIINTQIQVPIQIQPQINEKIIYKLNERPESKSFGAKSLFNPINQQQKMAPPIQQTTLIYNNQIQGQKTSLIQLVQPQTPKYNQQPVRSFSYASNNYLFSEIKAPKQTVHVPNVPGQLGQKGPIQLVLDTNSPSSFLFQRPSAKSLTERTQKRLNSYVVSSGQFDNLQSFNKNMLIIENNMDNINNHQQLISENITRTGLQTSFPFTAQTNTNNQLKYQKHISSGLRVDNLNLPKTSNIKGSQYTTVDIDDGKSSQDFFKKLKQFSTFKYKVNSQSKESFTIYKNSFHVQQRFNFPSQTQNGFGKLNITKELQNMNNSQQILSAEQFGRNAVSNIISNQSGININTQKNITNTPLKFQKNLDMKYSMFKPDEPHSPNYAKNYSYHAYETNYDAEILADINKLKS